MSGPDTKAWPLCGYAPGSYSGRCISCDEEFTGDKRAVECMECAARSANFLLAEARSQIDGLAETNSRLASVLEAAQLLLEVHDAMGAGQSASAIKLRKAIAECVA